MQKKIGNAIIEVYEILLRFAVFLIASLGVTHIMTADVLTGFLWVRMFPIVWGIFLADVGLLMALPFFSPKIFSEVLRKIYAFIVEETLIVGTESIIRKLKTLPMQVKLQYVKKYLEFLATEDVVQSSFLKDARDGIETSLAKLCAPYVDIPPPLGQEYWEEQGKDGKTYITFEAQTVGE